MCSLTGFRPPIFSEDDAWLPPWLQQCGMERLNEECIHNDHPTFQNRIEELQCPPMSISNGESFGEHGGCNIGHLYLSGTIGTPFSCAQSAENVVQFHLCLLSDEYSENTSLASEPCQTKPESYCSVQPLNNSAVSLHQKAIDFNLVHNSGALSQFPTKEVERPVHTNELLRHEENVKISDAAADAVELCIAASEALVIDEVIKSDSSLKLFSASAILEASLQVNQARLEVCDDYSSGSIDKISEIGDLSDLEDSTMESAYEDAGLYYDEFPGNDLNVSQVKDTLESECYENKKIERTDASITNYGKSDEIDGFSCNRIQLEKDVSTECIRDDTQDKGTDNPTVVLRTDRTSNHNDWSRSIQFQPIFGFSVSQELMQLPTANLQKINTPVVEENCQETDVASSPITSCRDAEKDETLTSMFQERFQSRWFGGWTSNIPQNEMKGVTTMKRSVPGPFATETSFFSESADVAPDGNSFVQHKNEWTALASQLSTPSQNFPNSASLMDPLCSVVPCSILEDTCLSPTINHNGRVLSGHFDNTIEQTHENLLATDLRNELAQGQGIDLPMASTSELPRVSRKFSSLRNYSKVSSIHAETLVKSCHKKRPLFLGSNPELTSHETPVPEPSICMYEDPNLTAIPETNDKRQSTKNVPWTLSKCKNQDAQQFPTSKHVRFSEKETKSADKRKLKKIQTTSNDCLSARASRRSTQPTSHLEPRSQMLHRFLKKNFAAEKKRLIFQNMEFVLTGLSCKKEKEIEGLIRKYGGTVLPQVPSVNLKGKRSARLKPEVLPIVICLKKIQSIKFLYGCAVNAFILKLRWLIDSIASGFVLPPEKYVVLSRNIGRMHGQVFTAMTYDRDSLVFNNWGIMLHGKAKSFPNIATVIKHGGGQVFKSMQRLVQSLEAGRISMGVVVAENENNASRHLKHCASEQNIPMTSVYWIIRSLYAGRLIPLDEKKNFSSPPAVKLQECQDPLQLSQEI